MLQNIIFQNVKYEKKTSQPVYGAILRLKRDKHENVAGPVARKRVLKYVQILLERFSLINTGLKF